MRSVIAIALCVCVGLAPALAAPARLDIGSREAALKWIGAYRAKPQPARVPEFVRAVARIGAFNDPESAGAYVGFIAGVLNGNPDSADELVTGMLPLPPEDHWVIVRAVAYSGLPDWKEILARFSDRMPTRQAMIDKFINGKIPTLTGIAPPKERSFGEKVQRLFDSEKREADANRATWAMESSPELLDVLWGYYFATGSYAPIHRMIAMLSWSKDRDYVEKLTVGSMTKYTLTINAARDPALLAMLKRAAKGQDKDTAAILNDAIDAAETADTVRIRKQQMAAIEELKRKGPGYKRELTGWGQIGEGAIGVGCVTAAVMSAAVLGIPCVVGGAATSAALRYWGSQQ
ncbi:MAG TPA: hypothetical protein VJL90_00965 [Pseudorhodoplanes sp.]|nr:hypothetical protein [Pseudorhodoplanes sp.]